MVIKWKKRNASAVVVYVLAVSFLLLGLTGFLQQEVYSGMDGPVAEMSSRDYQSTAEFRNFISSRFHSFLNMACGDYVGGDDYYSNYGDSYSFDTYAAGEAVIEQGTVYEGGMDSAGWQEAVEGQENTQQKPSISDRKKSADRFHEHIQEDKNLLYRISYDGVHKFSNLDGISWNYDSKTKNLPEGYNFLLYFDGKKATVRKDGEEVDLYGDGIYREEEGWRLPGFKNYTGKEKWKKAKILILAAEEPVLYAEMKDEDGGWTDRTLYDLYQRYSEKKDRIRNSQICLGIGVLLLLGYLFLRREVRQAGKTFAAWTGKIWFEWKALLFLLLPIILCTSILDSYGMYDIWTELGYEGIEFTSYASMAASYSLDALAAHELSMLVIFWLFHLFVSDVFHNRGGYKKGGFGKLAAVLEQRSLSLPLSRKIVKRTYGIIFITVGQTFFLGILLLRRLIFHYGNRALQPDGSGIWDKILFGISFAVTIVLLFTEYRYQKKNRQFAEDLKELAGQITEIRDGNYEREISYAAEDADIRHMASDLEDIRKGLETAVEERTGSERMKVELVANVSHDIKTPLTSIISYIQLLKQEEGLPDHIRDYIRILDVKSERLNHMVQDVFDISKAASGQLRVEQKELDLGKLLHQTLADMQETIEAAPVTIKTEIPSVPVIVRSDGGRMYRVFQNLIGNALKYSLEGSRIYVSLQTEGNRALASIKNISNAELDQQTDFTERFLRGDESRTDGGSGLGLSIAKSFTEACGGTFGLEMNADLFVVTVTFQSAT